MAKIKAHVAFASSFDLRNDASLDPGPNKLIVAKFKNKVFQHKTSLDGAPFHIVRKQITEWKGVVLRHTTSELILLNACIVIDEEALNSLLRDHPELCEADFFFEVRGHPIRYR